MIRNRKEEGTFYDTFSRDSSMPSNYKMMAFPKKPIQFWDSNPACSDRILPIDLLRHHHCPYSFSNLGTVLNEVKSQPAKLSERVSVIQAAKIVSANWKASVNKEVFYDAWTRATLSSSQQKLGLIIGAEKCCSSQSGPNFCNLEKIRGQCYKIRFIYWFCCMYTLSNLLSEI